MNEHLRDLRGTLASLAAQPDDAPWSMTGATYTDAALFEHEARGVLARGWHCLIRADEVPEVGDFVAIQLLGEPLLVVRSEGGIEVLSNLCRHRGLPLAQGQGNAKRFVCAYHAWTYDLNGTLLRAPRMKNAGFDAKACRLPRFPVVERFGFVYTNLDPEPVDFDSETEGLDALIADYEPEAYHLFHAETGI